MEEEVLWCGGALLMTLSVIYLDLKAHLTSMATTSFCRDTPSHPGLGLVGLSFVFRQFNDTPPGCVRAILPRRWVMECCIRWPGLHNPLTSTRLRWFGMSRTAEWRKSSQQVLSICGNAFKTVGKAFKMKLVERRPRVWRAVIKAKNLKYKTYFYLFNLCLVTLWFHIVISSFWCLHYYSTI